MQQIPLYHRLDGNMQLAQKLIQRFSTSLPILIVRLTLALKVEDIPRARSQIAMLKEVASALAAQEIINELNALEAHIDDSLTTPTPGCVYYCVEHIATTFNQHIEACRPA